MTNIEIQSLTCSLPSATAFLFDIFLLSVYVCLVCVVILIVTTGPMEPLQWPKHVHHEVDSVLQSFIHSFIHCRHLYSASSNGLTQKRSRHQRGQNVDFSC